MLQQRLAGLLLLGHELLLGPSQCVPRCGGARRVLLPVCDIGEHDALPLIEHGLALTQHPLLLGPARLQLLREAAALALTLRLMLRRLLRLGLGLGLLLAARRLRPVIVGEPFPLRLLPQRLLHGRLVRQQYSISALNTTLFLSG